MNSSLASLSEEILKIVQGNLHCGEISENPWGQSMQAAAPGAENYQLPDVDLRDPHDHYRRLRTLWALSLRSKNGTLTESIHHLLRTPLANTFQPSAAISHLLNPSKILAPVQFDSGAVLAEAGYSWQEGRVPLLPELCQLVLLWALNGLNVASSRLANWLLPYLEFKTLWASERRYDKIEFYLSAHLFYKFIGGSHQAALCMSEAKDALVQTQGQIDPFFIELEKLISPPSLENFKNIPDPELGVWSQSQDGGGYTISLTGHNTSLGSLKTRFVDICAFGPQVYPLIDSRGFGVHGVHSSQPNETRGWTRCYGQTDAWMEVIWKEMNLTVRFMGLGLEKKMAFVFYVKGETAQIDSVLFRPKSLQRYSGVAKSVVFKDLTLECPHPRKVELIPLAGEGCFWGTDFLLAFEISPFEPTASFSFLV